RKALDEPTKLTLTCQDLFWNFANFANYVVLYHNLPYATIGTQKALNGAGVTLTDFAESRQEKTRKKRKPSGIFGRLSQFPVLKNVIYE
ncbi:MAG TPA: hypothetical protein PK759_05865, partial [Spirochaetales bacterium]|nr:hypothetical protein [Spirochaetales bacterium]HPS15309.1 hypothetical protein [Spirochaetales bacterium]